MPEPTPVVLSGHCPEHGAHAPMVVPTSTPGLGCRDCHQAAVGKRALRPSTWPSECHSLPAFSENVTCQGHRTKQQWNQGLGPGQSSPKPSSSTSPPGTSILSVPGAQAFYPASCSAGHAPACSPGCPNPRALPLPHVPTTAPRHPPATPLACGPDSRPFPLSAPSKADPHLAHTLLSAPGAPRYPASQRTPIHASEPSSAVQSSPDSVPWLTRAVLDFPQPRPSLNSMGTGTTLKIPL